MCDCITKQNAALKERYRRIDATFSIGETPSRVVINTYSIGPSLFGPTAAPLIVAEFCPFCGKAYSEETIATKEAADAIR